MVHANIAVLKCKPEGFVPLVTIPVGPQAAQVCWFNYIFDLHEHKLNEGLFSITLQFRAVRNIKSILMCVHRVLLWRQSGTVLLPSR